MALVDRRPRQPHRHDDDAEFLVVLFYKYVTLEHPEQVRLWQQQTCERLQLKGRIRVAFEGINGTAGGEANNVRRYIQLMKERNEFSDIDFKTSPSMIGAAFPSLRVELKKEIVTLGVDMKELESSGAAPHLSPEAFAEVLTSGNDDETFIIDVRNFYESKLGHFRHAILPAMRQFTEFPTIAKRLIQEHNLKDKKVLMYCTGGIRCERASAFMRSQGVRDVFQLKGGIHRFLERYPDGHGLFEGKNFVFDERIAIASTAPDMVFGACDGCREPYDNYAPKRRCRACRVLLLLCDKCAAQGRFDSGACHPCKAALRNDAIKA